MPVTFFKHSMSACFKIAPAYVLSELANIATMTAACNPDHDQCTYSKLLLLL